MAIYLFAFVMCFEIFGSPVRDKQGWLGPVARGNPDYVDIGKVYFYEGTDYLSYSVFRPMCRVWLWAVGV